MAGRREANRQRAWRTTAALVLACAFALLASLLVACDWLPVTPSAFLPTIAPDVPADAESATPTPPLSSTLTLEFWEPYALDRPQGLLLGEMVHDFDVQNPDISMEIIAKSGYTALHEAMLAELPDGDLPDVAVAFPSMIAQYAESGLLVSLDPYLADPELGLTAEELADLCVPCLESGRLPGLGGQLMAFPFVQNAIGLWANRSLLQRAGWDRVPATWSEFELACHDVYAATGVRCYPFIESTLIFDAWLLSRGGRQLDQEARHALFNSAAGVESLALLRRLIDAGLAWRPDGTYGDYVAFSSGQAAFSFSSTGNGRLYWEEYQAAVRNGSQPFVWGQFMIPQANPQRPATALHGTSFFVIHSEPERERAAWRFIRWFTEPPQVARWAGGLETMPVRTSALELMTDTLAVYPFVQAQAVNILPYAQPEPALAAELEVRDILYTAILSVTLGYADPQAALEQAAGQVEVVLGKGQ